jgi:hypothetical protein
MGTMSFAKKLSSVLQPRKGLKLYLHEVMSGMSSKHDYEEVHASDLTKEEFCPREFSLLTVLEGKRRQQFVSTSLRYTFDMGIMLAQLMCEVWARNIVIGNWVCLGCGNTLEFCKAPSRCQKCGSREFRYKEVRFLARECNVSGGVDMLVQLPGEQKLRLVELKSIEKDGFKALMAPLSEHRMRTSLYLRLVVESSHPWAKMINPDEGILLYMAKGFGVKDESITTAGIADSPFSPFKEFMVSRDDKEAKLLLEKAKKVADFRKGGPMPGGVCVTAMCSRANACSVAKPCFGGEYPPGWKDKAMLV